MRIIKNVDPTNYQRIMQLVAIEQKLRVELANYLEYQKLQLKRLESIKQTSKHLLDWKTGTGKDWWDSLEPEMKKNIQKYARLL